MIEKTRKSKKKLNSSKKLNFQKSIKSTSFFIKNRIFKFNDYEIKENNLIIDIVKNINKTNISIFALSILENMNI